MSESLSSTRWRTRSRRRGNSLGLHLPGVGFEFAVVHQHPPVAAVARRRLAHHAEADDAAREHEVAVLVRLVAFADVAHAADGVDRRLAADSADPGGGRVRLQGLDDGEIAVALHGVFHHVEPAPVFHGEWHHRSRQQ